MTKISYRRAGEKEQPRELLNCWEFMNCGREKGGLMTDILGECPVSTSYQFDGCNNGKGAGRACWMVADSACRIKNGQSRSATKCHQCAFYRRVLFDEEETIEHQYAVV